MASDIPSTGLRERQRLRTRAEVLDAALTLFAERGFHEVTVDDICARADISARTFFRHFGTKDALLSAPFMDLGTRIRDELQSRPLSINPWDALKDAVLAGCRETEASPKLFLLAGSVTRKAPELMAATAPSFRERERAINENIARRLPEDSLPDTAALLTSLAFVALESAADAWVRDNGKDSLEKLLHLRFAAIEMGPIQLARGKGLQKNDP